MSNDRLSEINNVLREPLRQRILLKLGRYNSLDFNDLMKSLKTTDPSEVSHQLSILQELTVEGEHIVREQDNSVYLLTEKGHYVLDKMIAFPELKADNFGEKLFNQYSEPNQSKPRPKWFTPYWVVIFVSTIIVVGIVIPFFGRQTLDSAIFYTAISLLILGLAYYVRVKTSLALNKLVYIGLLGFVIGCVFWFIAMFLCLGFLSHDDKVQFPASVISTIISFTLGPLIGGLIGKARHFKGPEKYSP